MTHDKPRGRGIRLATILLAAAAVLAMLAPCVGCGDSSASGSASASAGGDSLKGQHLVFIGDDNFKPYRYVSKQKDGSRKVVGLDIAVADELSKRLGFTYEFKPMPFSGTLTAIQNRQADFSMSLSSNPEREQTFDFTQGYYQPRVGVLTKDGVKVSGIDDLKGLKLTCMTGTVQNQMIAKLLPDAQLTTYDTADQAMQEVKAGRADAYVCDGAEGRAMAEANEGLICTLLPVDETADYVSDYRIMGYKGATFIPRFDKTITAMKKDGSLDKLIAKWVGSDFTYAASGD